MDTPQARGRKFEKEIGDEFDLYQTPASGALFYSKLDLAGFGSRWSCKFTEKRSFRLTQEDIEEAIRACTGVGGDGTIPVWALRIGEERYDLVIMRKEDFKLLLNKEISIGKSGSTKNEMKKKRAATPQLLREEESG